MEDMLTGECVLLEDMFYWSTCLQKKVSYCRVCHSVGHVLHEDTPHGRTFLIGGCLMGKLVLRDDMSYGCTYMPSKWSCL